MPVCRPLLLGAVGVACAAPVLAVPTSSHGTGQGEVTSNDSTSKDSSGDDAATSSPETSPGRLPEAVDHSFHLEKCYDVSLNPLTSPAWHEQCSAQSPMSFFVNPQDTITKNTCFSCSLFFDERKQTTTTDGAGNVNADTWHATDSQPEPPFSKDSKLDLKHAWEPVLEYEPECNGLDQLQEDGAREGDTKKLVELKYVAVLDKSWHDEYRRHKADFDTWGYKSLETSVNILFDHVSYLFQKQFGYRIRASRVILAPELNRECPNPEFPSSNGGMNDWVNGLTQRFLNTEMLGVRRAKAGQYFSPKDDEIGVIRFGGNNGKMEDQFKNATTNAFTFSDTEGRECLTSSRMGAAVCGGRTMAGEGDAATAGPLNLIQIHQRVFSSEGREEDRSLNHSPDGVRVGRGKFLYNAVSAMARELAHNFGVCDGHDTGDFSSASQKAKWCTSEGYNPAFVGDLATKKLEGIRACRQHGQLRKFLPTCTPSHQSRCHDCQRARSRHVGFRNCCVPPW